jgi:tetratricopeptide (TPR) repeat protein
VPGYESVDELGKGAMGIVYKARQIGLDRLVALKMILPSAQAGPAERTRFQIEAKAVAHLQHPNIVQIFEVGEHDGLLFFSLELCPGGNLAHKLEGKPLLPKDAARLVGVLAEAMQAAHAQQIIHRDLKPANVLLGADGTPKVTDFGLAKKLNEPGLTHAGEVMGTPAYMPPEQAEGRTKEVGPLADVYALSAILYEALTGRPPFLAATTLATLRQVCEQEVVSPRSLQPQVPRDLETICLKGLEKDPARRYASAGALADDLRRFVQGEPILARPVPAWERSLKWARRRPAAAALLVTAAAALLAISLGCVFFGLYKSQESTALRQQYERRRKVDQLWGQGKDADSAGRLALARGQPDEAARRFTLAAEYLDGALATLDAEESADLDLRRQIVKRREQVREYLAEQARRQQWQDRIARFLVGRDDVLFHEISLVGRDEASNRAQVIRLAPEVLGWVSVDAGRPPAEGGQALLAQKQRFESPEQMQQVAEGCYEVLLVWAEAEASTPPERPAGRIGRAREGLRLLDVAEALGKAHGIATPQAYHLRRARYLAWAGEEKAAAAERTRAGGLRARTVRDHFLAGLEAYRERQYGAARAACALAVRRQPEHFWAQYLQALCLFKLGKFKEAKAGSNACLALAQQRRRAFPWLRVLRAYSHTELGEFAEAEEDFSWALSREKDELLRYVALTNRSALRVKQKQWDAAVIDARQAIALRPAAHPPRANLAQAEMGRKKWSAAITALDGALACQSIGAEKAALYHTRARAHLERKDRTAARKDFEQALAHEPAEGRSDRRVSTLVELGYLKHQAREYAAALADFNTALKLRPNYAFAHRQRAETLLALNRHEEAGQALDRYLRAGGKPTPAVYLARGMIHARLRQHQPAVEAYSRSLILKRDALTLSHRGWAYLQLDAARPALADFSAALRLRPRHVNALCGRGNALVRLGKVKEAVEDAEAALRNRPGTEQIFLAACIYARAARLVTLTPRGPARVSGKAATGYEKQALELLARVMKRVPQGERAGFWRKRVLSEPALAGLRRNPKMVELARSVRQ